MALSNIIQIIINANDNATAVLKGTAASIGDTSSKLSGISSSATASGKALTEGLTVPIVGMAAAAVKMAADFQTSMTRLVTSAGESEANLASVSAGVLQIADQTGTSTTALATAMYTVESGGQHGAAGLEVLKAAAEGAKTENADLATVADAVTSAMTDYHLSASQAADVTSKLVAATGQGKTTFQDLAGAMSAILPKASAAHISLDEILGDLASMTLHGISAEQASQNLADAVSHLQAPTQAMSKEMAALGLNSTELSQNLGTAGLTGTIQQIATAIQSQMGSQSTAVILNMQNALKGLPQSVQDVSQQVINGTATWTDWNKATKDLTVTQKAQADAFETLFNGMHTIGTEQMSGAQVMQTYSGALEKAMGDTSGLNVALMLTGENSTNTANAISAVSGASADASGNVQGWAEIQQTFNLHLSQFEATLQTSAITLGNDLLPPLTKLVDKITAAANWFEQLNPSQQKWLEETAGIIAVVGPALLITGKFASSVLAIGNAFKMTSGAMGLFKTTSVVKEASAGIGALGTDAGLAGAAGEATTALGSGGLLAALGPIAVGLGVVAAVAGGAYLAVKSFNDAGKNTGAASGSGAGATTGGAVDVVTLQKNDLASATKNLSKAQNDQITAEHQLAIASTPVAAAQQAMGDAQAAATQALDKFGANSPQYVAATATLAQKQNAYYQAVANTTEALLTVDSTSLTLEKDTDALNLSQSQLNDLQPLLTASLNGTAGGIATIDANTLKANGDIQILAGTVTGVQIQMAGFASGIQTQITQVNNLLFGTSSTISQVQGQSDKLNSTLHAAGSSTITISGSAVNIQGGSLPHNALGTSFAPGGLSLVGEQGPELVNLPRGSKVTNARDTKQQMGKNVSLTVGSIINNTQVDMQRMMRNIGWKIAAA